MYHLAHVDFSWRKYWLYVDEIVYCRQKANNHHDHRGPSLAEREFLGHDHAFDVSSYSLPLQPWLLAHRAHLQPAQSDCNFPHWPRRASTNSRILKSSLGRSPDSQSHFQGWFFSIGRHTRWGGWCPFRYSKQHRLWCPPIQKPPQRFPVHNRATNSRRWHWNGATSFSQWYNGHVVFCWWVNKYYIQLPTKRSSTLSAYIIRQSRKQQKIIPHQAPSPSFSLYSRTSILPSLNCWARQTLQSWNFTLSSIWKASRLIPKDVWFWSAMLHIRSHPISHKVVPRLLKTLFLWAFSLNAVWKPLSCLIDYSSTIPLDMNARHIFKNWVE